MTAASDTPLRIRTIADNEASTPKPWIVRGVLAAGEVSGLVSPPAIGKSAFATDLAGSIAIGKPWFGRKVTAGAAVYVAAERGEVTLRRLRAFALCNEVKKLDVAVITARLDLLNDARDAERILAAVRDFEDQTGRPVKLIVLDTVRALLAGGDENSPRDMGNFTRYTGLIRDGAPDAHLLALHHTPKNRPAEASGHTAFAAMVDVMMVVSMTKGGHRSWHVAEANDLPALPPRALFDLHDVTIGEDHDGVPITAAAVRPVEPTAATRDAKPTTLPPDTRTALGVLEGLERSGKPIQLKQWQAATLEALGDRKPGAKRQAFSTARKLLIETAMVRQSGEIVSVSTPSG